MIIAKMLCGHVWKLNHNVSQLHELQVKYKYSETVSLAFVANHVYGDFVVKQSTLG